MPPVFALLLASFAAAGWPPRSGQAATPTVARHEGHQGGTIGTGPTRAIDPWPEHRPEPDRGRGGPLTDAEARAIAARFAPRFRFHRDEPFLPVDPLFVLGTAEQVWPLGPAAARALGSAADRTRRYLALTLADRLAYARVFYDVYRDGRQGAGRLVVEYWLYFVDSRYRTRGGFFPFPVDLSHPNDFEHVFLVLAPSAGPLSRDGDASAGFRVERIITSVHDRRVPNHVTPRNRVAIDRPLVLVELGSHSLVPDADEDGRVLASVDVEPERITWGLRDTGRIWAWQSPDDAESREPAASMTLKAATTSDTDGNDGSGADTTAPAGPAGTYQLAPLSSVDAGFRRLGLSPSDEDAAFRGRVNLFKRLFGKSDGGVRSLRRPSTSPDHRDTNRLLEDSRERQRGISLGFTNTVDSYAAMVGGRFGLAMPPRPWPAVTADVGVVFPLPGPVVDVELLASYEIDTQVDLFGGTAWLADGDGRRQVDWLLGLQLQLGRFRFRGVFRQGGEVNNDQADFRIQYDLWK